MRCGFGEAQSIKARASSRLKGETIVFRTPDISSAGRAYIDIETDLGCKYIWLVGVHIESESRTYAYLANTPEQEKIILEELHHFLCDRPELTLLNYSNCRFEQRLLPQRFRTHSLETAVVEQIRDIYYEVHACAAFPSQTTTLKDVPSRVDSKRDIPRSTD